jgi:tetratricopeptide (TPR) repeat protein
MHCSCRWVQEEDMNANSPETFAETLGLQTRQMAALVITGYRLYEQGHIQDAAKIFEGIAVLDSGNPYVHGILGSIYQKLEEFEPAIVRYNNALSLLPGDIHSLTNRGEIFLKLGRFQEAAEDLKHAIRLDVERNHPASNRSRLLVALVQDALALTKMNGTASLEDIRQQVLANNK